ncbi:hypothetical protein MMC30_008967 [Trapelia coarctata]|nr:hypothetical protein [Trapelia coarctata]
MAEYRNLAPFPQNENSSASSTYNTSVGLGTPNTHGTSSGGTGGSNTGSGSGAGSGNGDAQQRRRRTAGQVSVLACTECRRARAKCDGERPATCYRCQARGLRCIYEPHTKTHKNDLLREIETMRAEHAGLQDEHFVLQESTRDLEKMNQDQSVILDILTNNGHVDEIISRLRTGESQDSIAQWLQVRPELTPFIGSMPGSERSLLAVVSRVEKLYNGSDRSRDPYTPRQWTRVTMSPVLIRHLFELYFTWVHPVHMLFGEVDFLKSYRDGDEVYCSDALVNAVCAMACHLLDSPVPGLVTRDARDRMNLRDGFMAETRSLLKPGKELPMTSIQAFAVMYLVELSAGKARNASSYLRCAADNLSLPPDSSQHAEKSLQLSAWGIHTLNTAWSGITYQKPFNPVSPRTAVFINVQMDKDSAPSQWRYYRQPGDETNYPKRQSFAIVTACEQAKLYRIVHDTINVYCGARGRATAAAVIGCYKRFLNWQASLSEAVRHVDEESQPLPHVLCLQYVSSVQYHTSLVQLFRPLAHCRYFKESDAKSIANLISYHARSGLDLLRQCMRLYSCRYNMPLTAFCIVHLADAFLKFPSDTGSSSDIAAFCLEVLGQNQKGFSVCGPLGQVFWTSAREAGVELPESVDHGLLASLDRYGVDDILDACTRLSYAQPVDQIGRYIDSAIGDQWHDEWKEQIAPSRSRRQSTTEKTMQITSLLNN